ncbi:MAG: adenosine kinase [Alphaproteobacteria bacterium GM7ARS4]|nr:adenosine kinase [Alphaproteobacteria bacterium GM7ARS4]
MMGDKRYHVVGIGNAVLDVLVDVDDAFLAKAGILKHRMTLVGEEDSQRLYRQLVPQLEICGGSVANTMVGLASLGGRCAFLGKVADDGLGRAFSADMSRCGVTFTVKALTGSVSTARCLIFVTPDGHRSMQTFLGASSFLGVEDVEDGRPMLEDTSYLFLEGYLWSTDHGVPLMERAATIVRGAGGQVVFSLSDVGLAETYRDGLIPFIKEHCDIVFANELEAYALTRTQDVAQAQKAWRSFHRRGLAIITRGDKGSIVMDMATEHHDKDEAIDAVVWKRVVDSTGAGDLYAAGFLHGLVGGHAPSVCGHYGALCAAEVISHFGARPQTPLLEFLDAKA